MIGISGNGIGDRDNQYSKFQHSNSKTLLIETEFENQH